MSDLTPLQRAQVKASMYLMDTISYIASAMSNLSGQSECEARGTNCDRVWNGNDPARQNLPTYLNPQVRRQLPDIFPQATAYQTPNSVASTLLTDDASNTDLNGVLPTLSSSSLSAERKGKAIAGFYLLDVVGYIANAMMGLGAEPECVEGNGISTPESVAVCNNIWNGNNPENNIPTQLTPNARAVRTLFRLAAAADQVQLQTQLEQSYLTDVNNNVDLKIALCNIDPTEAWCPAINGVSPDTITRGTAPVTVDMTITGVNFPANPVVEIMLGDQLDPNLTPVAGSVVLSEDKKTITLKVEVKPEAAIDDPATAEVENQRLIRVASATNGRLQVVFTSSLRVLAPVVVPPPVVTLNTNCTDGLDNDRDHKADAADEDCDAANPNPAGESTALTGWQRAADVVYNMLHGSLTVEGGHVTEPSVPLGQEPAADAENLNVTLRLGNPNDLDPTNDWVTIFGLSNPLVNWSQRIWELQFNLRAQYEGRYTLDAPDTNLGALDVNINNRLHLIPHVPVDIYGGYNLNGGDYAEQNRWYFDGITHQTTGGLAANSDFGTRGLLGRVYGEYRQAWFTWDEGVLPEGSFSGRNNSVWTGGSLTLDVSQYSTSKWAPSITANGSYSPYARFAVPELMPGMDAYSYEGATGWSAGGNMQFNLLQVPWYVAANYSALSRENWADQQNVSGSVGFNLGNYRGGKFDVTAGWSDNFSMLYGGENVYGNLTYTFDPSWFRGADAFSVTGSWGQLNGANYGGASAGIDILKLIVPTEQTPPDNNR
ncbi:MAG: hypothetical protein WC529_04010 [Candidatus Margulisiibacteriota bacterium]